MLETQKNEKHCLNSISFYSLGVVIFISEFISSLLNILCLSFASWKFLKSIIKTLNIVCLCFIGLTIIINIIMFCSIKNIKQNLVNKYKNKLVTPVFLFIFYLIIIIFNIYNAIYLSINLHIADYPEYGGRKRDQEYINSHPDEFGNVPLHEFIIVAVCPSLISVFNLLCIIITCLYKNKIIIMYNIAYKERYGKYPYEEDEIIHKRQKIIKKEKKDQKDKNKKRRKSIEKMGSTEEIVNSNETDPECHNVKNKNNNELIKIKINNSEDGEGYEKKLPENYYFGNIKFDSTGQKQEVNDVKGYNKKLPESFYFGERKVQTPKEEKEIEFNFNNNKNSLYNSKQGTKLVIEGENK